jgi:hypothetical protein
LAKNSSGIRRPLVLMWSARSQGTAHKARTKNGPEVFRAVLLAFPRPGPYFLYSPECVEEEFSEILLHYPA